MTNVKHTCDVAETCLDSECTHNRVKKDGNKMNAKQMREEIVEYLNECSKRELIEIYNFIGNPERIEAERIEDIVKKIKYNEYSNWDDLTKSVIKNHPKNTKKILQTIQQKHNWTFDI